MATTETRHQFVSKKVLAFGWLFGFLALFAAYLYVGQWVGKESDDAGIILEGQAMLHGNFLMHGWYLPSDSFITTDMPIDALGSIFFTGQQLINITPALLYAATVLGAAYLASQRIAGSADSATRWLAAAACVALIAFPIGVLFFMVMQSPFHIGTILLSLLAFLAYDHVVKRPASFGPLCLFVLVTTLAVIGDPMAELLIVMPVGIVSAWMLWRSHGRERTARATLGGALLALLLGVGVRQALIASGTFISSATLGLASLDLIGLHILLLVDGVFLLFHINLWPSLRLDQINLQPTVGLDQQLVFLVLTVGFLVVCTHGFIRLFRHTLIPRDMQHSLTSVLSWAMVSSTMALMFTTFAVDISGLRFLLPTFVYAAILCYSALARVIARPLLARVILALLGVSGLAFGVSLAQAPRATAPQQPLIAFLKGHHLTYGLGTYWVANITTLRSNKQVQVLPILLEDGRIRAQYWHASASWFAGQQLSAVRFVVIDGSVPEEPFKEAVINTFGSPDHVYNLDTYPRYSYVIFAWNHSIIGSALGFNPPVYLGASKASIAFMQAKNPGPPSDWHCRASPYPVPAQP